MFREGASEAAPEGEVATAAGAERWLRCAACRHGVARDDARITMASGSGAAHEHEFVNPSGLRFRVGCFASAPGARPEGERETVWSWFPGHAWQLAVCGGCGAHLGWSFHAASGAAFWGLILDRLALD